jgi:eukaryotic-like serine/threonine-protein kinase
VVPLIEETLTLYKAKFGPDHLKTIESMDNLGVAYRAADRLDAAVPLLEEALKLYKAKLGPEHRDTLNSMKNLAGAYRAAGKPDLALSLYEELFKLWKAKLGADHPDTRWSMNGLASGYLEADKFDLALPLFEEMLKHQNAKFPPEHPNTLATMNNLAVCYRGLKRFDLALPLLEQLVPIQEKQLGRTHTDTQWTVANLAFTYVDLERVAEAIPLLEETYRARKKNASLPEVGEALLTAYVKTEKTAEARKLSDELLADARQKLPKESPQLAGLLAKFGLTLLEIKGYAEAEPLLRDALAIREKSQPDDWTTFNTQSLLGGALLGQNKSKEAEPLLLKGYEGMKAREKTIPPEAATRIPEALDRLVELDTATNKPDEVKKYQELRAKYRELLPPPRADK